VRSELVFVAALARGGERGHRAFLGDHKAHSTAFEPTGETT
jgi:hypothetical protein